MAAGAAGRGEHWGRILSGARSRNKGAAAEREFLRLLGDELGAELKRNIVQTREGGADCLEVKGWAIEVKRQERLSRPTWWRQTVEQSHRVGAEPMLAYRRSREPWTVIVRGRGDALRYLTVTEAAGAIREKWAAWP